MPDDPDDTTADDTAPAVEPGDKPDDADDRPGKTHNTEAAKYRTRLRQAEAERDVLL